MFRSCLTLLALLAAFGVAQVDSYGQDGTPWNDFLRKHADVSALFAASLSQGGNYPGAADFFTEALRLLPGEERWDARRAEYARRLVAAAEGLETVENLSLEDRRYLMEAAAEFTREARVKPPAEALGFHPLGLHTISIPKVEFSGTPFLEALDQIERWSREFDPDGVGLKIEIEEGIKLTPNLGKMMITLRLPEVTLAEALRYTCTLAQTKYTVEDQSVRVEMISSRSSELPSYHIPVEGSAFAPLSGSVKSHLEERGFSFLQGGGAYYDHGKRELFVKARESQIPGMVLWLRIEGTLRDEEDVHRRGLARMARAEAYGLENLTAASESRYREALGYFVWLEENHKDVRLAEISERIAELRERLRALSP